MISFSGTGTILSQNSTQMIFTNIATADRFSLPLIFMGFSITTPPSTRSFSFKFSTEFLELGNVYDIETVSQTYQNNAGVITSSGITVTSAIINAVTSYQI